MTENITLIDKSFLVEVYKKKTLFGPTKKDLVGKAKVIGAYFRPYWHPCVYTAYHVIFEDGRKDTVYADHCKEVTL